MIWSNLLHGLNIMALGYGMIAGGLVLLAGVVLVSPARDWWVISSYEVMHD